ncbi:hypothetical protein BCON_0107g00190 [Botryotinia convoluta]|uniref:Uncharacterized protein n=1 Tax=Botryotinia convoluta TaxID=54673 RepID=A0A4Z1HYY7_9HELO|nr:hypothetical protein BCON_0107g00190 [Botryotinia convoluta]
MEPEGAANSGVVEPGQHWVCRQRPDDITSRTAQQTGSLSTLSLPQTPTESPSEWEKRTKRFKSTFGPKRGDGEPSEWWISMLSRDSALNDNQEDSTPNHTREAV